MSRNSKKRRRSARSNAAEVRAVSVAPSPPAGPQSSIRLAPRKGEADREKEDRKKEEAATAVVGAVVHAITEPLGIRDDGRSHPRVDLHVEIDLCSDSHFFSGLSGDVSEGGLFVQTYRPLSIGQEVDVSFDLDGRRVEARAVVRWRRERTAEAEPGFGLEFEGLEGEERALVHAFCERRAPLYYDVI